MPIIETTEENTNDLLKTRWYNNNYHEAKMAILKYAKANNAILTSINDEYMEILMTVNFKEMFIKITEIGKQVAVDLRIETSFLKSKKGIIKFYEEIGQFLYYAGIGLMAGK